AWSIWATWIAPWCWTCTPGPGRWDWRPSAAEPPGWCWSNRPARPWPPAGRTSPPRASVTGCSCAVPPWRTTWPALRRRTPSTWCCATRRTRPRCKTTWRSWLAPAGSPGTPWWCWNAISALPHRSGPPAGSHWTLVATERPPSTPPASPRARPASKSSARPGSSQGAEGGQLLGHPVAPGVHLVQHPVLLLALAHDAHVLGRHRLRSRSGAHRLQDLHEGPGIGQAAPQRHAGGEMVSQITQQRDPAEVFLQAVLAGDDPQLVLGVVELHPALGAMQHQQRGSDRLLGRKGQPGGDRGAAARAQADRGGVVGLDVVDVEQVEGALGHVAVPGGSVDAQRRGDR